MRNQVELARNTLDIMWGFSVEAELVENNEKQVNVEYQGFLMLLFCCYDVYCDWKFG